MILNKSGKVFDIHFPCLELSLFLGRGRLLEQNGDLLDALNGRFFGS